MSFLFVHKAVEGKVLTSHGLWNDIGEGAVEADDPELGSFQLIQVRSSLFGLSFMTGIMLSFGLPLIAFALLKVMTELSRTDTATAAAHYEAISIMTFVAGTYVLEGRMIDAEGYMVAVDGMLEAPAILSALWLVVRGCRNGRKV